MLQKIKILNKIIDGGIVAVIRAESEDQALKAAEACLKGGISAIEVTFTVPSADKVISALIKEYKSDVLTVGAGTVLDAETSRIAILSGAQYVVTPYLNIDAIRTCNRYQIPIMSGAMSVRDVAEALEAGTDIVKLFPGEFLGPSFIKSIRGPIPYAPLMPTGGVSLDNVTDWFKAGVDAVGVGGSLTSGIKTGDYKSVTEIGKKFVEKIQEFKKGHNVE